MSKTPEISVIIPIYNVEKYLRECLDSVINQSLKNIEIICVNDGSTDETGKIIDEYINKDNRIKKIEQKNKGVAVARNRGYDKAIGKYVIFLDSDDVFEPNMLEEMIERAKKTDADIVICREKGFYSDTGKFFEINWPYKNKLIPKANIFNINTNPDSILNLCTLWPWDKLYKKEFLDKINIKWCINRELEASEDLVYVGETLARAEKITVLDKIFIKHRIHNKSLEATRKISAPYLALKELKNILIQNNLYKKLEKSFTNLALDMLNWHCSSKRLNTKEMHNLMHNIWLKEFNLIGYPPEYFFDKQQFMNCISKYSYSYAGYTIRNFLKRLLYINIDSSCIHVNFLGIKIRKSNKHKS